MYVMSWNVMEWNGNQGTWLLDGFMMNLVFTISHLLYAYVYIYMCIICYTLYIYHFALDDIVWAKQCHKPPMFGNYWGG